MENMVSREVFDNAVDILGKNICSLGKVVNGNADAVNKNIEIWQKNITQISHINRKVTVLGVIFAGVSAFSLKKIHDLEARINEKDDENV
jgi:hypothetical protein